MDEFDVFAATLLEESKRFLEKANDCPEPNGRTAYLHAGILLAYCALEAFIATIAEEFKNNNDFTEHELALLIEKEVRIRKGKFTLANANKFYRIEDKIEFLHRHFSGVEISEKDAWWSALKTGMKLRNDISHPKNATLITLDSVTLAIAAVIDTISALFKAIYGRDFPAANRRLQSKLTF
jgi:hypothetical protein